MRTAAPVLLCLSLTGCGDPYSALFGLSNEELARTCGVSTSAMKEAKARVESMEPYKGTDLGKCSLIKDDSGAVVVGMIAEPPKVQR